MLPSQSYVEELIALRNLEQAVRACGLPSIMVSGQQQLDSLAAALKAIEEARASNPPE
jgi:TPP-dependent pyruvate/acetoin dehydrogenase alpha subunit